MSKRISKLDLSKENFMGLAYIQLTRTTCLCVKNPNQWYCYVRKHRGFFEQFEQGHAFHKNKFTAVRNAIKNIKKQFIS